MANIESPQSFRDLPSSVIKSMVTLSTNGFGLVVALAWNEVIKRIVSDYVDPFLGKSGSLVSLLIYASVMTFLAVFITLQLSQVQKVVTDINGFVVKKALKSKPEPETSSPEKAKSKSKKHAKKKKKK